MIIVCKVCGGEFIYLGCHLKAEHNLSVKDYYDEYIDQHSNKICPMCDNELKFISINRGYTKYCSHRCSGLHRAEVGDITTPTKNPDCWEIRVCGVCGNGFECYGHSSKIVCSNECKYKYFSMTKSLKTEKSCIRCGSKFMVRQSKINKKFCSTSCYHKWAKLTDYLKGEKSYMWGRKLSEKTKEKISDALKNICQDEAYRAKMSDRMKGEKNPMYGVHMIGEDSPNWLDGRSFEPYSPTFNNELRQMIRERDNHTCQECGMTQEQLGYTLSVHHIDYDKKNSDTTNLISLCNSCHVQANFNRDDWTKYYRDKIMDNNL